MFRRFIRMDDSAAPSAEGKLQLIASTDAPCEMGNWREVLTHNPDQIDTSAATALLINHNPDQIAGVLRGCKADGKQMCADAELIAGAKMESGILVADAIKAGALRGISVGYTYSRSDAQWNEETRTLTVSKWRMLEASLTPIPADTGASLRSVPFDLDHNPAPVADPKERHMPDPIVPVPAPVDPAPAILAEQAQVAVLARSLKLDAAEYVGKTMAVAQPLMLAEMAKRSATEHPKPAATITITHEDTDKQVDAITEAMSHRVFGGAIKPGNPYAGRKIRQMAAKYARFQGVRTEDWTDKDEANFAVGDIRSVTGMRDAPASVIQSSFSSFVFLNAITKIVGKGFESAPKGLTGASGAAIYETQRVPDFKSYTVGGLGMSNLVETAENTAFPELTKTEGAYSNTAKMWGGTVSWTVQAAISDDTSSLDRALRQAGPIAQKGIERRLVQKFLRGVATTDASTWTSNTTSGCTPVWTTADTIAAARANMGKVNAALQAKIGLDGNPTGNMARFLFAGPTAGNYLSALLNQAPGQSVANTGNYELVVSPWLEASAITGYSTTSFYGIADPMLATGLILSLVNGYETVQVQEFDAGAVGARKWKLWIPYEADLFWAANSAGTSTIFAAQQATT